jgi:hypothetical protein
MGKTRSGRIIVSIYMEPMVVEKFEERLKTLGITRREYFRQIIIKDIGLKYVPARYEELKSE